MTARAESTTERTDARTLVQGGLLLGLLTAVGVAFFALVSRALSGPVELGVQAVLVLVGGVLFAYWPAAVVRPASTDGVAWAALVGLLGALAFTVLDTALLRPFGLYHWSWDQIGGGSGFWYIPVWWMGSAVVAWLGAWAAAASGAVEPGQLVPPAVRTAAIALVLFAILGVAVAPFTSAVMALAFVLALPLNVALVILLGRR